MSDIPTIKLEGATVLLRRLLRDFGAQNALGYVLGAICLGMASFANIAVAWLLKPVLNGMVAPEKFAAQRSLAFLIFGLFVMRGVGTYASMRILSRIGNRIVAAAQAKVFDRLLQQNLAYFQDRSSHEFVAKSAFAAGGIRDALQLLVQTLSRDVFTTLGLIGVMIQRDPLIASIALSVLPIAGYFIRRVLNNVGRFAKRAYSGSTLIMQTMSESIVGIRIVKAFNLEDVMRERMRAAIRKVEGSVNRVAAGGGLTNLIADALAGLAIGFAIFYSSWRISVNHQDVGSFISFLGALLLIYEPAKRLARFPVDIQNGLVGARAVYDVLDAPLGEARQALLPKLTIDKGRVEIIDGRFAYRPGADVINHLNLVAQPGATTALVGPSGGGKTTILGLIQRFYALGSGRVLIDGQDISGFDLASLRQQIAFVSQDVFLFQGTIRENIALGRLGASEDEIAEAARQANAHDFISALAMGYQTPVGEQGMQLSGGQRQRIAIARAMLKNAPILLLDEPTAALDSESEREVQKALDRLRRGRTTIVVAHRLQTIVGADAIMVIESGRGVVESGSHAELIKANGAYCAFFSAQFGPGAMQSMGANA